MNTEQANAIPLSEILATLGFFPARTSGVNLYFLSPLREERTASFHVNTAKNLWFDHGLGIGGTVIDFIVQYLKANNEDHTVTDALRWAHHMLPAHKPSFPTEPVNDGPALELQRVGAIKTPQLIDYANSRGISFSITRKYMKEAHVLNKNTGNMLFALALRNENGGYELRNAMFKGCIAPKTISFFRGTTLLPREIHVFEGGFDYLSALMHYNVPQLQGDALILNSVANLDLASPYLRHYGYKILRSWLDNDTAGEAATAALRELANQEPGMALEPMNALYRDHKDVNAWHMTRFFL